MDNGFISEQLDLLAKLLDIHGENSFKVINYANAAYTIKKWPTNLGKMSVAELEADKSFVTSIKAKIIELVEKGSIKELEDLLAKTPEGVVDMMRIKGLGPKKIITLWKDLDITSIGELEYACQENRLMAFKGFGAKTQAAILEKIQFLKNAEGLVLWKNADEAYQSLITQLAENCAGVFLPTGDYYQQLPVLATINIVTDADIEEVLETLEALPTFEVEEVTDDYIVGNDEKGQYIIGFVSSNPLYIRQFEQSCSDEFLAAFQQTFGVLKVANDEQHIFAQHQLAFIPPALRHDVHYLELAKSGKLPLLIQTSDIKGIIHNHSTYSDGMNTLKEMAAACIARGYEYLVISDHSKSAFYANGLTYERIKEQFAEIDKLNQQLAPFKIFKSIECDILNDGSLDYEDAILAQFDLVIASIHSNLNMNEEKAMQRLLTAISNKYTTILGHPTGRLLLSRAGYPVDYKQLIDACVANKVVIEINAHPRRLDLDFEWLPYAIAQGAMLSIDPDAHAVPQIDLVHFGVMAAQKGGLTATCNLSSMSLAEFEAYLADIKAIKQL